MMYLKLAWRNMWRSRRRTMITVSSILFAVVFAILMRVMVVGMFEKMIADTVRMSIGYIQIHHIGYWENKTVDSSFEDDAKLNVALSADGAIASWTPRLESFALASSGEHTKGILVTGIRPERENSVSKLSANLVAGSYLADTDNAVLLSAGLAQFLRLGVNDTVIFLGQGYHGDMANGKYPVKGIVKLGIPEMNRSMAWIPINRCRDFLGADNKNTSLSLILADNSQLDAERSKLAEGMKDGSYEVMTWQEMMPELDQFYKAKMAQNMIMSGVLYLVIAFGIFGTILMMLNERQHEFGILIAIGMRKNILALIVVIEMAMMSVIGAFMGIVLALPITWFFWLHPFRFSGNTAKVMERFNLEPVIRPSLNFTHFVLQTYVVLGISLVLSVFAVYRIFKIKAISAINS